MDKASELDQHELEWPEGCPDADFNCELCRLLDERDIAAAASEQEPQ